MIIAGKMTLSSFYSPPYHFKRVFQMASFPHLFTSYIFTEVIKMKIGRYAIIKCPKEKSTKERLNKLEQAIEHITRVLEKLTKQ